MGKYSYFITRYPKTILFLMAIITGYMGFGITKLQTRNNYDADLPANDPIIMTDNRFSEIFGKKDNLLIGIESHNIYDANTLEKIFLICALTVLSFIYNLSDISLFERLFVSCSNISSSFLVDSVDISEIALSCFSLEIL